MVVETIPWPIRQKVHEKYIAMLKTLLTSNHTEFTQQIRAFD